MCVCDSFHKGIRLAPCLGPFTGIVDADWVTLVLIRYVKVTDRHQASVDVVSGRWLTCITHSVPVSTTVAKRADDQTVSIQRFRWPFQIDYGQHSIELLPHCLSDLGSIRTSGTNLSAVCDEFARSPPVMM